jgi:hypothetical protein
MQFEQVWIFIVLLLAVNSGFKLLRVSAKMSLGSICVARSLAAA